MYPVYTLHPSRLDPTVATLLLPTVAYLVRAPVATPHSVRKFKHHYGLIFVQQQSLHSHPVHIRWKPQQVTNRSNELLTVLMKLTN